VTRAIIASVVLALVQGCSIFTQPKANPVLEDRVHDWWGRSKVGILATTPERRVVIVKMPENRFCAEPPADAADNVSAALTAVAQASDQGRVTEGQLGIAQALATSVKQLFQRSQGVQLYRDGTFMLCNAYLNGAITQDQFLKKHEKLLETVAPLIDKEIPELHRHKSDEAQQEAPALSEQPQPRFPPKSADGAPEETAEDGTMPGTPTEDSKKEFKE